LARRACSAGRSLAELADLKGYRFWHPDPDSGRVRLLAYPCPTPEERAYYNLLNDLSADLAT
jgi:hypothetical protein